MPTYACNLDDLRAAQVRLAGKAHRTPVATCTTLDEMSGCRLVFKCEHLQKVGAFKFRGAFNAVSQLSDAEAARGVVTHSSGNHAQAIALAARMRGAPAYIVMPTSAPEVKRRAVAGYGAKITPCEPNTAAREETADRVQRETGAAFIPPYDHPHVIAGQSTVGLELLEQASDVDVIVAPVGGGGLISGICLAACAVAPSVRIIAAEPQGADDAARSLAAGKLLPQTAPDTIADGLLTSLGELTWPIIRDHITEICTVDDRQIIDAMRLAWERGKFLIEPSAAVSLAVVLTDDFRSQYAGKRVGVVFSGGNVDLANLPWR